MGVSNFFFSGLFVRKSQSLSSISWLTESVKHVLGHSGDFSKRYRRSPKGTATVFFGPVA
jgi:hypothetical protein